MKERRKFTVAERLVSVRRRNLRLRRLLVRFLRATERVSYADCDCDQLMVEILLDDIKDVLKYKG